MKIILFLFAIIMAETLFATPQYGDKLIIGKDTVWIYSYPLEKYFKEKGSRTIGKIEMKVFCTALWRGYVATWKLENNRLFLVKVETGYCNKPPTAISIIEEFGSNKVLAHWVNETIVCPQGRLIQSAASASLSIHEREIHYTLKAGKLVEKKEFDFLEKDKYLLFPEEKFLKDTIKSLILKSIDKVERDSINIEETCFVIVEFNEYGELSCIKLSKKPNNVTERIVLRNSKKALQGVRGLMKVYHKRYCPIEKVEVFFSGYNIKYPHGRKKRDKD
ncbi:hypothetical protein [Bacteroides sp. 224]|uniref:hypothetical protein n=1 Tax=Bacteroides sp. 224 TaxID=2302936 RepID=UPI0013D231F3|nr:hypothetical protein [Bacteroides sp. 224]NDV64165.1 hypothetical protein [Bacteroides sp. 224]